MKMQNNLKMRLASGIVLAAVTLTNGFIFPLPAYADDSTISPVTMPESTTTTTSTTETTHVLGTVTNSEVGNVVGGPPTIAVPVPPPVPPAPPAMVATPPIGTPIVPPAAEVPLVEPMPAGSISDSALQPQKSGDVTYITGGVGDEERATLDAVKKDYNLHIMIANKDGTFVGDTRITIHAVKGAELLNTTAGPLFYVRLAPGTYTIEVFKGDKVQKQKATISAKGAANLHFSW